MHDYPEMRMGHVLFIKNIFLAPVDSIYKIVVALGQTCCYLGLFCLPALIPFVFIRKKRLTQYFRSSWPMMLFCILVLLVSAKELLINQGKLMPFNQNLLRLPMICALTIMGLNMPLLSKRYLKWLTGLSYALSFLVLTLTGSLVSRLFDAWQKYKKQKCRTTKPLATLWVCTISIVASIAFSLTETIVRCTDRYYLIAFAPLILGLVIMSRYFRIKLVQPISVIALILIAGYSACAAQDYLGWNRVRWSQLSRLEAQGISSLEIDGGYEYNSLRDMKICDTFYRGESPRDNWRWWPIKGEKYISSFSTIPGYKVIDRASYWSALTFSPLEVLVLEREKNRH
jgi:hypothetical protein